jgi:hypothetical protein
VARSAKTRLRNTRKPSRNTIARKQKQAKSVSAKKMMRRKKRAR